MARRLALLALAPLLLAACGGSRPAASTTAGPTTTAPPSASAVVYFLRDGDVAPARVPTEPTKAVATAALRALFAGPPAGLDTAIPDGVRLRSVSILAGVATVTLEPGAPELPLAAEAQVVYTLTRFATVTGVTLADRPILDEHGQPLTEPATRADFEDETPAILVESPLPGDAVASPLRVTGTANVFEATFQLELAQGGKAIARTHVTASSGSGERGTFDVEVPFSASGPATLVAYEASAEDGSPLHRVELPLTLR